jgi:hypothetical protein
MVVVLPPSRCGTNLHRPSSVMGACVCVESVVGG